MTGTSNVAPLELGVKDLVEEITVFPNVARDLIAPECLNVVHEARSDLRAALAKPDSSFTWQVQRDRPILTAVSDGAYEDKKRGKGQPIVGALSFLWKLRTSPAPVSRVFLSGNITTQIRLRKPDADEDTFLAMWRMEIGDPSSPGCCFHTQVLGNASDPPFPKDLPIPRFPTFPPTPMTCLEFLLGEMFQSTWNERVERENGHTRQWRHLQKRRFRDFLTWQQMAVDDASGSPLTQLKRFPPANALCSV